MNYENFVINNRKSKRWCKPLSIKEIELVEDAKKLIKKVDNSIEIADFNVYKIGFSLQGFFYYDEDTKEMCIFIPFTILLLIGGENLCFLAVLHEVLHSQNLKNNEFFFKINFLEGLNQLLTIWLVENYSEKYKIPKRKCFSLRLTKNIKLKLTIYHLANTTYIEELRLVKEVLKKDNDLKEVFMNYIDMKPEYFKSFVPLEYFEQ